MLVTTKILLIFYSLYNYMNTIKYFVYRPILSLDKRSILYYHGDNPKYIISDEDLQCTYWDIAKISIQIKRSTLKCYLS